MAGYEDIEIFPEITKDPAGNIIIDVPVELGSLGSRILWTPPSEFKNRFYDVIGFPVVQRDMKDHILYSGSSSDSKSAITAKELVGLANNSKVIDGLPGTVSVGIALQAGQDFVGKGYTPQIGNGSIEYTSKDGTKRFRMKTKKNKGVYEANYETLKNGKVQTNYHVQILEN